MVDDCTNISWELVHEVSRSWVDVLILYVLLFGVIIWPDAISDI
jgi:hypothetical protein